MTTTRSGPASPVHVVVSEPSGRDHSASPSCWCSPAPGPLPGLRDLSTGASAWVHRASVPIVIPATDLASLTYPARARSPLSASER
jgi:hypothetical protein